MDNEALRSALEHLTEEARRANLREARVIRGLALQFARGLAFGLGTVLGASLLVSLAAWWLSQFEFLPIIGEWAAQIAEDIRNAQK
ncbi:MAG: hypothetical protein EBS68_05210 [Rhodobacteraceae bacterium]|jgi:hypothetical protein|nr:hypothetical protein [Paracoccaceae bacterium]